MREKWEEVEEFPNYLVSTWGNVYNAKRRTYKAISLIRNGTPVVQFSASGRGVATRSVAVLVARAFLPVVDRRFDTVINLNGYRSDCHVGNLMWRPRPFAIAYHKQFGHADFDRYRQPIEELNTGDQFEGAAHAATTYGLIYQHVVFSYLRGEVVWPTGHRFQLLN